MLAFFFNISPTPAIYTLSLHDALPISERAYHPFLERLQARPEVRLTVHCTGSLLEWLRERSPRTFDLRSEEHTSELQSHSELVCRLLLEKKNSLTNTKSNFPSLIHPLC